jgi:dTDP-4-dehydrorhamnose 3,5-epimerase-like enzyme
MIRPQGFKGLQGHEQIPQGALMDQQNTIGGSPMPSLQIISLPDQLILEARGWSFSPFKRGDLVERIHLDWSSLHLVEMDPGTVRGNHYHPRVTEWLFFYGKSFLLVWQDLDSEKREERLVDNHHTFVIIPPMIRHAVKNISDQPLYLLAFRSPSPQPEEQEVFSSPLIS